MKNHFPFFSKNPSTIYLDSAATTQRLHSVIDATNKFLGEDNATVHRAAYKKATEATQAYERTRLVLSQLINARSEEIVFTSGATESINIVAEGLQKSDLVGNKILICASEHHANLLPWQKLAARLDLQIEILPLSVNGTFTSETFAKWASMFDAQVCLLACAHVSNVLGNIYPVKQLCELAQINGAISVIDGTQAVAHLPIDVKDINCDFYVFSGHKMYGSTGVGVLYGKYRQLDNLQVSKLGGEMVASVSFTGFTAQPPPLKFEAGTPNISGVIALRLAARFLMKNLQSIVLHEQTIYHYLLKKIRGVSGLKILGNSEVSTLGIDDDVNENALRGANSIGILSFVHKSADNHSLVEQLWQQGIALRYGHHCAMPLLNSLKTGACIRVSIGAYSDKKDIDNFLQCLSDSLSLYESQVKIDAARTISSASKRASEDVLIHDIKIANDWSTKHRSLLLLSKCLPILDVNERNDNTAVLGCEASVWLKRDMNSMWEAYSDSKVIRGILALLLYADRTDTQVHHKEYLENLGLSSYFSEGRRDGINKIIARLHSGA